MRYDTAVRAAVVVSFAVAGGCARDPAEAVCPSIDEGDLVVTEIRGPQTSDDSLGPWIELYNASGTTVDLLGTKVRFRRLDGSSEASLLVRRDLPVAAATYTVLGVFDDAVLPEHIDYGFAGDFRDQTWLSSAAVVVEACGAAIDRADYGSLPRMGTYSLGGTPSASANDLPAMWCTDASAGPTFPGTPQAPNLVCP